MEHHTESNDTPSPREWMVPAILGFAIVVVVGGAEYSKRHANTASADADAGTEAPTATAPAGNDNPSEIEASHVLVMYRGSLRAPENVTRSKDEAQQRVRDVLRRARANQDFAGLAREFSDEPGAGDRGGALGRFGRGAMVPAFEQAAFALRVGQVSDVVETPFGYHVIKRTR